MVQEQPVNSPTHRNAPPGRSFQGEVCIHPHSSFRLQVMPLLRLFATRAECGQGISLFASDARNGERVGPPERLWQEPRTTVCIPPRRKGLSDIPSRHCKYAGNSSQCIAVALTFRVRCVSLPQHRDGSNDEKKRDVFLNLFAHELAVNSRR